MSNIECSKDPWDKKCGNFLKRLFVSFRWQYSIYWRLLYIFISGKLVISSSSFLYEFMISCLSNRKSRKNRSLHPNISYNLSTLLMYGIDKLRYNPLTLSSYVSFWRYFKHVYYQKTGAGMNLERIVLSIK